MKLFIYSYNSGSQGAKELSLSLGIKRIKRENSKFRGGLNKVVINWGSSVVSDQVAACHTILNKPEAVMLSSNKLKSFELFQEAGVSIPQFWNNKEEAHDFQKLNKSTIVCRTILNGHSGVGIILNDGDKPLEDAPLYVNYIPKKQEYRYHVFEGKVIDVQRKARNKEIPDDKVNWKVRNHDNGFIFMREGVEVDDVASKEAINAVACLGLDFGAVDIIWNEKENKYYVLEVNSAPGLTGTTLDNYTNAFKEMDFWNN